MPLVELPTAGAVLVGTTTRRTRMNLQTGEQQEPRTEEVIGAGTNLVQLDLWCKKIPQPLCRPTAPIKLRGVAISPEEATSQLGEAVVVDKSTAV